MPSSLSRSGHSAAHFCPTAVGAVRAAHACFAGAAERSLGVAPKARPVAGSLGRMLEQGDAYEPGFAERTRRAEAERARAAAEGDAAAAGQRARAAEQREQAAQQRAREQEERARAEMLLARDERKRQKKDERKQGQGHKPALREKREEWRAYRREQAVARAAGA